MKQEYSEAAIHILPSREYYNTSTQESITMGLQGINLHTDEYNWDEYNWPEFTDEGKRLIHYVDSIEAMIPAIQTILESNSYSSNREYAVKNGRGVDGNRSKRNCL